MQFEGDLITWVLIPALIFLARIIDVTIGTLRIIFVSKGLKMLAPILGFFESLFFLIAITQIIQNVTHAGGYIGFAAGFAAGNYVGIWLEEQLAMGLLMVQVITRKNAANLIDHLRGDGFGVTTVPAHGSRGPVSIIYTIIKRGDLEHVEDIIKCYNPRAFYSIEEVKGGREIILPPTEPHYKKTLRKPMAKIRKRK